MPVRLFQKASGDEGLQRVEEEVRAVETGIRERDEQLRDLYVSLKTDILDEFLKPQHKHLRPQHIRVLREQVRHVVSVARVIGYAELVAAFTQEDRALDEIEDLVHQFPDISADTSPALRSALEHLRNLLTEQQRLIFAHEEILYQEKRRIISILEQVEGLRDDMRQERSLERSLTPLPTQHSEFS